MERHGLGRRLDEMGWLTALIQRVLGCFAPRQAWSESHRHRSSVTGLPMEAPHERPFWPFVSIY